MAQELIFIRHGQTRWNVEGRLQGLGDSPLTPLGRTQARDHLGWLRHEPPDRMLVSPLGRAQATARILASELALDWETEPALAERGMGRLEGWTLDEVARHEPELARVRAADPWRFRAPGGENYDDLLTRVRPLLDGLAGAGAGRVLLISHGTLVRPMLGHLLRLDRATMLRLRQPNGLAYQVRLESGRATVMRRQGGRAEPGLLLESPPTP